MKLNFELVFFSGILILFLADALLVFVRKSCWTLEVKYLLLLVVCFFMREEEVLGSPSNL